MSATTKAGLTKIGILACAAIGAWLSGDKATAIQIILGGLGLSSIVSAFGLVKAADQNPK